MEPIRINIAKPTSQHGLIVRMTLITVLLFLCFLLGWSLFQYVNNASHLKLIDKKLIAVNTKLKNAGIENKIIKKQAVKNARNSLTIPQQFIVKRIYEDVFPWTGLLDEIEVVTPKNIILDTISTDDQFVICSLAGRGTDASAVTDFMERLKASNKLTRPNLLQLNMLPAPSKLSKALNAKVGVTFKIDAVIQSTIGDIKTR